MEPLAIFVNDAAFASRFIEPLLAGHGSARCALVLCPPRLTQRIGKWVCQQQRQQWRQSWSDRLRLQLCAAAPSATGSGVSWCLADDNMSQTLRRLRQQLGTGLKLVDLRKHPLGRSLPPVAHGDAAPGATDWQAPVAVTSSLSVMLALVD